MVIQAKFLEKMMEHNKLGASSEITQPETAALGPLGLPKQTTSNNRGIFIFQLWLQNEDAWERLVSFGVNAPLVSQGSRYGWGAGLNTAPHGKDLWEKESLMVSWHNCLLPTSMHGGGAISGGLRLHKFLSKDSQSVVLYKLYAALLKLYQRWISLGW